MSISLKSDKARKIAQIQYQELCDLGRLYLNHARESQFSSRYLEQSFDAFARARVLFPQRDSALLGLAYLLMLNQEWHFAQSFLNQIFKNTPDQADALLLQAYLNKQSPAGHSMGFKYNFDLLYDDLLDKIQSLIQTMPASWLKQIRQQPSAFQIERLRFRKSQIHNALEKLDELLKILESEMEIQALHQKKRLLELKLTQLDVLLQDCNQLQVLNQDLQRFCQSLRDAHSQLLLQNKSKREQQEKRLEMLLDKLALLKQKQQACQNVSTRALAKKFALAQALLDSYREQLDEI